MISESCWKQLNLDYHQCRELYQHASCLGLLCIAMILNVNARCKSNGIGQMELPCVSPNQNQTPLLELRGILIPKEEASKVSLWGHAHALSASQKAGW
jgi:hypothetical protein